MSDRNYAVWTYEELKQCIAKLETALEEALNLASEFDEGQPYDRFIKVRERLEILGKLL